MAAIIYGIPSSITSNQAELLASDPEWSPPKKRKSQGEAALKKAAQRRRKRERDTAVTTPAIPAAKKKKPPSERARQLRKRTQCAYVLKLQAAVVPTVGPSKVVI